MLDENLEAASLRSKHGAPAFAAFRARVQSFVNSQGIRHEVFALLLSYSFIYASAWNDGLLGFPPTIESLCAEILTALVLVVGLLSRLALTQQRTIRFWVDIALDFFSLLVLMPGLQWAALARLVRMFFASGRLITLLDRIAATRKNPVYLLWVYPLAVPLVASALYEVEKGQPHSPIRNYLDALRLCFEFSLSLGNVRPVSAAGLTICGFLFLVGLMCIGILTNSISNRYQATKE
ncbi:MAG TPA: hypothetical protein VME66_06840 [Candidatus Acidoferrales bacterium]|nr:hypothetical protein [Candidatus Acidoferrales bacterium]